MSAVSLTLNLTSSDFTYPSFVGAFFYCTCHIYSLLAALFCKQTRLLQFYLQQPQACFCILLFYLHFSHCLFICVMLKPDIIYFLTRIRNKIMICTCRNEAPVTSVMLNSFHIVFFLVTYAHVEIRIT